MEYELPDEPTLAKYMYLLHRVLVVARARTYSTDPQVAALLDAVENLPDLLLRWPECNESIIVGELKLLEDKYPEWRGYFTAVLEDGAPADWQLRSR